MIRNCLSRSVYRLRLISCSWLRLITHRVDWPMWKRTFSISTAPTIVVPTCHHFMYTVTVQRDLLPNTTRVQCFQFVTNELFIISILYLSALEMFTFLGIWPLHKHHKWLLWLDSPSKLQWVPPLTWHGYCSALHLQTMLDNQVSDHPHPYHCDN